MVSARTDSHCKGCSEIHQWETCSLKTDHCRDRRRRCRREYGGRDENNNNIDLPAGRRSLYFILYTLLQTASSTLRDAIRRPRRGGQITRFVWFYTVFFFFFVLLFFTPPPSTSNCIRERLLFEYTAVTNKYQYEYNPFVFTEKLNTLWLFKIEKKKNRFFMTRVLNCRPPAQVDWSWLLSIILRK